MLFTVGNSKFRTRHLLVITILCISFSVSFLLRFQPLEYGFELHEFDPFFNYRATEFLLENGFAKYLDWHDNLSWYPIGRDVSATSQVMLHITAAVSYLIFGVGSSLYDFVIVMPAVFGSLTALVVFALVRVIAGTTAGLFASLFFAMSLPIILRGALGWFKSEPLGIFYGLLAIYLFLSGIQHTDKKIATLKMLGGGAILGFGIASWGGIQFFVLPLGVFLLALPFLRNDRGFLTYSIPIFVSAFLFTTALFERPGIGFVFGLGGLSIIVPTIFFVACSIIQKYRQNIRICLVLLISILVAGSMLLVINDDTNFLQLPNFRYLNAINPFLTATNPLTDSVSEHSTTSIETSFFFHSVLMIFSGLGIWLLFSKRKFFPSEMTAFAIIISMAGVYVSSAFVRLEVFASISIIILSSIALSILLRELFNNKTPNRIVRNSTIRNSFLVVIVFVLLVPFLMPQNANWISLTSAPPTIFNGGTLYNVGTSDWLESLEWIKQNTSEDAVIAAWWDYGYWISTVSQRATLADNSTLYSGQITMIAEMFLSTPDEAWKILQEIGADYVLVFVAGERLIIPSGEHFYVLTGGGDESKMQWFMKIADKPLFRYMHPDGVTANSYFWNETLLGKLFPFSQLGYVNFDNNLQTKGYLPGMTPVYIKEIKYPEDNYDEPFRLVYSSPGYTNEEQGVMLGVFVYEINHDYLD